MLVQCYALGQGETYFCFLNYYVYFLRSCGKRRRLLMSNRKVIDIKLRPRFVVYGEKSNNGATPGEYVGNVDY